MRARLNPTLRVAGIVDPGGSAPRAHAQVVERTRATFAGSIRVFETIIRTSVRLKEAPITGRSILAYEPGGAAAAAYRALAGEVEDAGKRATVPTGVYGHRPSALDKLTGAAASPELRL